MKLLMNTNNNFKKESKDRVTQALVSNFYDRSYTEIRVSTLQPTW